MTVLNGEGGLRVGPLKTFTTTLATPRENLLTTPVAMPSTEPTTAQISITVEVGDLPTISPSPISTKYTALIYAGGKNADAAAQNVSWRVLKNGVSVATGTQSAVPINAFWTHSHPQLFDIAVGDVLEIKLWSPSANVNYDYYAIQVYPTNINLGTASLNKEVTYSGFILPSLTSGTPAANVSGNFLVAPSSLVSASINMNTGIVVFGALAWDPIYRSGRVNFGDVSRGAITTTHATNRPLYNRNYFPTSISFRELR